MASRFCKHCGTTKLLDVFVKNNRLPSGYSGQCKECRAAYTKQWKADNPDKGRMRYVADWVMFFSQEYGDTPECEICDRQLVWLSSGSANTQGVVNFDHRREGVPIVQAPKTWLANHPCNEENRMIWLSCRFGVLCLQCNKSLPTINRGEWLRKAQEYHGQTETNLAR